MPDLISRDKLIISMNDTKAGVVNMMLKFPKEQIIVAEAVADAMLYNARNAHAVDAVPVVHGHWIVKEKTGKLICSNCRKGIKARGEMQIILAKEHEHYCYHCGAKMDEKDGEKDGI